jgi:5-methyltetrahydropteroyltriglutamate--homocysteine methyltransferase
METHVLGFPRIGAQRELKHALDAYWRDEIPEEELIRTGTLLRQRHWRIQKEAGLSFVATGDFSFYDHVLDTAVMLGLISARFGDASREMNLDLYFRMARGDRRANIPALEMTKWFDTNYHYLVPEFTPDLTLRPTPLRIVEETRDAVRLGYRAKPVLLGPITFLCLGKAFGGADRWERLDEILAGYRRALAELAPLCEWIQIDEPVLCTDLPEPAARAFAPALRSLKQAAGPARLLLATYFGGPGPNLGLAADSGCDGLHIDFTRSDDPVDRVLRELPASMTLSAGVVDGRNVWKNDLSRSLALLRGLAGSRGPERVMAASGCSLLHVPVDLGQETDLDPELKSWMAFAVQKCGEVGVLGRALAGADEAAALRENANALAARRASPRVRREEVRSRAAAVAPEMLRRASPYAKRREAQAAWLKLPRFPTTTIGSFPQTEDIRSARLRLRRGEWTPERYETFLKEEIRACVQKQERLGLDVLVHGEPERNDMVEYFGQQLDGFCFTRNGWVQSYGSRCVKPPVIFGDVARPKPMTVDWAVYAQSLTKKPMKGMLTGPVTILCWSFVRDDLPRADVCRQLALALRDEVRDLEAAGIRIIQIDEAALREGLPLRRGAWDGYLRQAVDAFRLTSSGVADATQIHTHMCYSEFNAIVDWIAGMDADVISIESSRSKMELLEAFERFAYPNEIGPGVYDIHSPRVPSVEEILGLLRLALRVVRPERLWVNPDCGLKTRGWPETLASLTNLVAAAHLLRKEYA